MTHDPNGCGVAHRLVRLTIVRRVGSEWTGMENEHTGVALAHVEESPVRQV